MTRTVHFVLNDVPVSVEVEPRTTLLDLLRDHFKLWGAREGCGEGVCGACTVLVDDRPVSSCCYLAPMVEGASVRTVEGLGTEDRLDPVQEAFADHFATQCGYCTPGFILTTRALFQAHPDPTDDQVDSYLNGNICRCTGYVKIKEAVAAARDAVARGRMPEKGADVADAHNGAHSQALAG